MQEKMDIFCPRRSDSESNHYQSVFLVDEESFNLCRQNEKSKKVMSGKILIRLNFELVPVKWRSQLTI